MKIMLRVMLVAALVGGCQREVQTGPFEISGRLFVFNYRISQASYLLTLKRIAPIAEGMQVRAKFENPAGGPVLEINQKVFPAQEKVVLESPPLACVRKDRPYSVTITVLSENGETVQELQASVTSDLDQSILPAKPMVSGPAYQRNQDAFDSEGNPVAGSMEGCPAH
ncbi:MAG: hypothetical protein R3D32_12205 [Nitratireductor sp.]